MFDRPGEPNHLFKTAVSNFQLIVRDAFAAGTVTPRAADAQQIAIDNHVNVCRFDACQIDFHDPTFWRAIDISRRTPQAPRRPPVTVITNQAEITIKRFAGHKSSSVSKSFEGYSGVFSWIIEVSRAVVSSTTGAHASSLAFLRQRAIEMIALQSRLPMAATACSSPDKPAAAAASADSSSIHPSPTESPFPVADRAR